MTVKKTGMVASFNPKTGRGGLMTEDGERIAFDVNQIKVDVKIVPGIQVSYRLSEDKNSLVGLSTFVA